MSSVARDDERSHWQCRVCAAENRAAADGDAARCWACGRPRQSIDWPRRIRRIGAIAIGVAIHVAAGVLFWRYPPGTSAASWSIYLGMGLVGFLHIFIGGEMLRRDRSRRDPLPEPPFTAAALGFQDHRCPRCEASVLRAIERGVRRCPTCEAPFSMRELGWDHADPAGEPSSLGPSELRINGAFLVATLIVISLVTAIALWSVSAPPGP